MRGVLALLIAVLASCATVGDVQEIADATQDFQREIRATLERVEANSVSVTEARKLVADSSAAVNGRIAKAKQDIETRVEETASAGLSATESGGITLLGMAALWVARNFTRGRDKRVSNRYARSGSMRGSLAPFILVGIVIAFGCTTAALKHWASSLRGEFYAERGGATTEFPRFDADTDSSSIGVAVSMDLIPQAGVDEQRAAIEAKAALDARNIQAILDGLERAPPAFEQSPPDPWPPEDPCEDDPPPQDPPPPAAAALPWYVTTEGVIGISALLGALTAPLLHPPTRRRLASKATEFKERRRAKKAQKESNDEHPDQ